MTLALSWCAVIVVRRWANIMFKVTLQLLIHFKNMWATTLQRESLVLGIPLPSQKKPYNYSFATLLSPVWRVRFCGLWWKIHSCASAVGATCLVKFSGVGVHGYSADERPDFPLPTWRASLFPSPSQRPSVSPSAVQTDWLARTSRLKYSQHRSF